MIQGCTRLVFVVSMQDSILGALLQRGFFRGYAFDSQTMSTFLLCVFVYEFYVGFASIASYQWPRSALALALALAAHLWSIHHYRDVDRV